MLASGSEHAIGSRWRSATEECVDCACSAEGAVVCAKITCQQCRENERKKEEGEEEEEEGQREDEIYSRGEKRERGVGGVRRGVGGKNVSGVRKRRMKMDDPCCEKCANPSEEDDCTDENGKTRKVR